jgi:orotate phosphoribosyltransferase-like protein
VNIYTTICLGITIAGFIGGMITAVAKLASKTGRLMERVEQNEKRDAEEREKIGVNFTELYGRMNAVECDVKAQGTSINNLVATCTRIESKLDRLVELRG